jgi:hypothetical protein
VGSFAFIEHRFLQAGFWMELSHHELLLYLFLVLAADRRGLSWYGYDKICSLLAISLEEYLWARDSLIERDLIAFDGRFFQVLSLPDAPRQHRPLQGADDMERSDPATVRQLISASLGGSHA